MFIIIFTTVIIINIKSIKNINMYIVCYSHQIILFLFSYYTRGSISLADIEMENYEEEYIENSDDEGHVRETVNNMIVEAIESREDNGMWSLFPIRVKLPESQEVIVMMNRNDTAGDINGRLNNVFGFRSYYVGVLVKGQTIPVSPHLLMIDLDSAGSEVTVSTGIEEWSDGIEIE